MGKNYPSEFVRLGQCPALAGPRPEPQSPGHSAICVFKEQGWTSDGKGLNLPKYRDICTNPTLSSNGSLAVCKKRQKLENTLQ